MSDQHEIQLEGDLEFDNIAFGTEDGVAVITFDRPDVLNALNSDLMLEFGLALDVVAGSDGVQALVLTGAGRAFVAGADINEFTALGGDVFAGRDASLSGQDVLNSLASLPVPTIAALNGFAFGGGLEVALACDLRVAASGARLGLPEVGLGLIPGYGGTQRLPRLIGPSRALDLIFTGRHVEADEALQLGLVNRVAEDAQAEALQLARQMITNSPVSLGLAKEAVVRGLGTSLEEGLQVEADLFGLATTTKDMKEGTAAFLEKRKPQFRGE